MPFQRIIAVDGDLSVNGLITYTLNQLSPMSAQPSFTVNMITGDLSSTGSLVVYTIYQLSLTATVMILLIREYLNDKSRLYYPISFNTSGSRS